ncbi:hypothetical protein RJT34_01030 [Clitoria ternatea]|uniref:SS18 N-terminal domain-containing protein n=1 Tax=Clitoria ternatea TaxID=43366 RepID=A0AAN9Q0Z0_CLITE
MFNGEGDRYVPTLTTEQIQKCLEENKELIIAIMEGQNLGKFTEIAQFQAKLQHNLTFLAKLADAGPQGQIPPQAIMQQGQGMQHSHGAMSQPQPEISTLSFPFDMNDQPQQQQTQQQQEHLPMSLHQPDTSTSKFPFQMNDQNHKLPVFFQQHQLIAGPVNGFPATNSGIYQASQTRLGNLSDTPSSNHIGSDFGPGWF